MSNVVLKTLGDLIAPLGINQLATLVVVLSLNEFNKYHYAKRTRQKGGSLFKGLVQTVLPMEKQFSCFSITSFIKYIS